MSGCQTCGGYGMKHDPVAHGTEPTEGDSQPDDLRSSWQWHAEFANEQAAMAEDFARCFQEQAAKQWRKADQWRERATGLYLDQPDDVEAWTESQWEAEQ